MLMDLLSKAATVAMLIWVVFSMLAMGTGLTLARIIERLRNVRLVLLALRLLRTSSTLSKKPEV